LRKVKALPSARPEKKISILLPAYNEALQIEKCVREVERAVSSLSGSYEIIVSEDGSTDGTDRVVEALSVVNPNLTLLHSPVRLGKGKAIKNALKSAKGDVIVFMDVDLATSLECLPRILELVKEHGGMAIGSRHVEGSRVQRRVSRTLFSLAYNLFVRVLFLDSVHDHQCGFKAMSREATKALCDTKADGFFFDTEMIVRCKKLGFPVTEVGVAWAETRGKRGSKVKLFSDAKRIGLDLLAFRLNES
jgi:glycosyltransferase involved in cell wall biosynthesis